MRGESAPARSRATLYVLAAAAAALALVVALVATRAAPNAAPNAARTSATPDASPPLATHEHDEAAALAVSSPAPEPQPLRVALAPSERPEPSSTARSPRAPVAGIVLEPDGSPAAGVELVLRSPLLGSLFDRGATSVRERVTTGADGRFATLEGFPAKRVKARGRRGSGRLLFVDDSHEHDAGREPCDWTLRLVARPELRLRIVGAGEIVPSRWRARVAGVERDCAWETLRDGEPLPWFRCSPHRAIGPARVLVASTDGVWSGAAAIATAQPVAPLEVTIEVESVGAVLHGRVLEATGDPVAGASVFIARVRDGDRPIDRFLSTDFFTHRSTGPSGWYELQGSEPGTYRIRVTAVGTFGRERTLERVVDVPAGDAELEPFVFADLSGTLEGRVRSIDGEPLPWLALRLRPRDDPGAAQEVRVLRNSRASESFRFERVPLRACELSLLPGVPGAFEPITRLVTPPLDDIELVVPRAGGFRAVTLRAIDAATRQPIELAVEASVSTSTLWRPANARAIGGDVLTISVPAGGAFAWFVAASGYRPARGTAEDLPSDGSLLEVPLERGWGAVVRLHRGAIDGLGPWTPPDPSLAGVALLADGETVALTDATATALVSLPRRPATLTFEGSVLSPHETLMHVETQLGFALLPAQPLDR